MKYYFIFKKYSYVIKLAIIGDWSQEDRKYLSTHSIFVSNIRYDEDGQFQYIGYLIYSISEETLDKIINKDCVEIKNKDQFGFLMKLCS